MPKSTASTVALRLLAALLLFLVLSCTRDERFEQYVDESSRRFERLQEGMKAKWKIGQYEHFDWDQQTGRIAFSSNGKVAVLAEIQFAGTFSKKSETWFWAWANSSIEERLRRESAAVAKFGRKEGFPSLVWEKWAADEEEAWRMTAVAARILGAEGAYRTESDGVYSYLLLKNIREAPLGYLVSHEGDRKGVGGESSPTSGH
jgi:hypothetical protein